MTLPRCIIAGMTYMLTRRCVMRMFLLRPGPYTNRVCTYVLLYAAKKHGIELHSFCFLSNHAHIHFTDVLGNAPEFMRDLHRLIAGAMNAHWDRCENLWSNDKASLVELADAEAVLESVVYGLTNPVKDGLVPRVKDWPGAYSPVHKLGDGVIRAKRPRGYFRRKGPMPATVELRLTPPPAFADMAATQYRDLVRREVRAFEEEKQAEYELAGKEFLGRKAILTQDPFDSPRSRESRRQLNPRVKARDKWKRIERLQCNKAFLEAYKSALGEWLSGVRDVLFPHGTYWLCQFGGARACAPP